MKVRLRVMKGLVAWHSKCRANPGAGCARDPVSVLRRPVVAPASFVIVRHRSSLGCKPVYNRVRVWAGTRAQPILEPGLKQASSIMIALILQKGGPPS